MFFGGHWWFNVNVFLELLIFVQSSPNKKMRSRLSLHYPVLLTWTINWLVKKCKLQVMSSLLLIMSVGTLVFRQVCPSFCNVKFVGRKKNMFCLDKMSCACSTQTHLYCDWIWPWRQVGFLWFWAISQSSCQLFRSLLVISNLASPPPWRPLFGHGFWKTPTTGNGLHFKG